MLLKEGGEKEMYSSVAAVSLENIFGKVQIIL